MTFYSSQHFILQGNFTRSNLPIPIPTTSFFSFQSIITAFNYTLKESHYMKICMCKWYKSDQGHTSSLCYFFSITSSMNITLPLINNLPNHLQNMVALTWLHNIRFPSHGQGKNRLEIWMTAKETISPHRGVIRAFSKL